MHMFKLKLATSLCIEFLEKEKNVKNRIEKVPCFNIVMASV